MFNNPLLLRIEINWNRPKPINRPTFIFRIVRGNILLAYLRAIRFIKESPRSHVDNCVFPPSPRSHSDRERDDRLLASERTHPQSEVSSRTGSCHLLPYYSAVVTVQILFLAVEQ